MARNGRGNGFDSHRLRARRNQRRRNGNGHGRGMPPWLKVVAAVGLVGVSGFLILAIVSIIVYQSYADDLVAPDELAINQPSYGARILDRNGNLLYEYVDDRSGLRRPVKLEDVSEAFLAATNATEDGSFFSNPGINVKGLTRAAWENTFGGTIFEGTGGSSITQQLVKNVYIAAEARQERWSKEGLDRKLKEMIYALELTQRYDKERILQWYVNQISYGGVYNGIQAAALGYFGKPAKDLTLAEAALLAGIPQSPADYDPVNQPESALARRNQILDLMLRKGRIRIGEDRYYEVKAEAVEAARQEPVKIAERRFPIEAPHFVLQYVEPQIEALYGPDALLRDGLVVTTTLDVELQRRANEILEAKITAPASGSQTFEEISNSRNGAAMVIDPKTGEVLVFVGSRDYFREDIEGKNNMVTACNSPGSSFKPFAYTTAFLELGWGPGTIILDTPVEYPDPAGGPPFVPTNPSKNFQGPITVRNALGNSLNVPANKTAAAVGAEKIVAEARKLGFMQTFRLKESGGGGCSNTGSYGPAIATGGVDVTLEEMVFGYTVLANGGIMRGAETINPALRRSNERKIDPVSILRITDAKNTVRYDAEKRRKEERVIEAEYAYLIWSILSDPQARTITFTNGLGIPGYQAAIKTGTSEPYDPRGPRAGKIGDTWAFGFTAAMVVGIWAGNSDNSPVDHIYSTSISFRAMSDLFVEAMKGRASTAFERPKGIEEATVCVPSGLRPTSLCGKTTTDLFVKDKLPQTDDDWWRLVRVDIRNGQLAGPGTPSQYVQEAVMLALPPELLDTEEERKIAQDWAAALSIPLAPTETSSSGGADLGAIIFLPAAGSSVSGVVQVAGRASSDDFQSYRLEYGPGASPTGWRTIRQSNSAVSSGTLGSWDTKDLPPGVYTLRLVVTDRRRGQLTATVTVSVGGPSATPTSTPPRAP